jgi:hypothetical protein
MAEKLPLRLIAFLSQGIGFLLLFIGTVVAIFLASTPASCYNGSSCSMANIGGTAAGVISGIMISKLLWALGLLGIGAGAGIHLRFLSPAPEGATPEATRIYLAHRRSEFIMFVIVVGLLFLLLFYSWTTVPFPTPG